LIKSFAGGFERIAELIDQEELANFNDKRLKVAFVPLETKKMNQNDIHELKLKSFILKTSLDEFDINSEIVLHKKNADKIFEYLGKVKSIDSNYQTNINIVFL
jgi:hypothetical protein